jgi:hypothetical protein
MLLTQTVPAQIVAGPQLCRHSCVAADRQPPLQ